MRLGPTSYLIRTAFRKPHMPRAHTLLLAPLLVLLVLLSACTAQPHLDAPDPALRARVTAALRACYHGLDLDPAARPPARTTRWQAELYTQAARDAAASLAAIEAGRLDPARLRTLGAALIARLRQRDGADAQPPHILAHLLDPDIDLDTDAQILLLGALNRLATESHLALRPAERLLLGKPQRPRPQRGPGQEHP